MGEDWGVVTADGGDDEAAGCDDAFGEGAAGGEPGGGDEGAW